MIALIVAPHGELRDGLSSLISVIPDVNVVSTTENLDRAIGFVGEHCPELLIAVVTKLEPTTLSKIKMMKAGCQQLKVIACVKHPVMVTEPKSGDLDAVISQYAKASLITDTVISLLSVKHESDDS